MAKFISLLDSFTLLTGRALRWLTLFMVILTCTVVFMRYVLGIPSIMLQESVLYLHATVFMAGIAYTWQQGGHVRVDVFSKRFSPTLRKRVEQLGIVLFVVPICVFLLWMSWRYVLNSWAISEHSAETGGLPLLYLLKSLLLIMPILLLIQAVAELAKTLMPATNTEVQHG